MPSHDFLSAFLAEPLPKASGGHYEPELVTSALRESLRAEFEEIITRWFESTKWLSSINAITRHPSFADAAAMGKPAIRFTLERIAKGDLRAHWFPLLKHIAKDDPVPLEHRGRVHEMSQAWLAWGKQNALVN